MSLENNFSKSKISYYLFLKMFYCHLKYILFPCYPYKSNQNILEKLNKNWIFLLHIYVILDIEKIDY